MILILLVAMIVMIFVDVISITGLVCVTAVLMVVALVSTNLWRGTEVWGEMANDELRIHPHELTYEDR